MANPAAQLEPLAGDSSDTGSSPRDGLLPWTPSLGERIAEAWRSRHLLSALAVRTVPDYRGRILGRAWLVLRPLMQVFGFAVIFGGVFKAKGPNDTPYLVFMLLNLQAFRLFERSVLYETLSSRTVKPLVRGLRLPLLLIPVAAMLRSLLELAIYWAITIALLVYYGIATGRLYVDLSPRLLIGLTGLALLLLFGLTLGLITAVIYPRAMDVRYVVGYGMQLWLFLTPVFYPLQAVPDRLHTIVQLNPLTPLIGLVQYGFLDAGSIHPYSLAWSLVVTTLTGALGLWFFNRRATQWIGIYTVLPDGDDEDEDIAV